MRVQYAPALNLLALTQVLRWRVNLKYNASRINC